MYLVTNDLVVYFLWAVMAVLAIFGFVVLWTLGELLSRFTWWVTTRPPSAVKAGDVVALRDGEWAMVRLVYEDGTYSVYVPAFGEAQVLKVITLKDMRPI